MTRKFIDQELSEILGASVGNVVFTLEIPSGSYYDDEEYISGIQVCRLTFDSFADLLKGETAGRYGSIILYLQEKICKEYKYEDICVYGEETARIAKAVASGLSV